MSLLEQLRSEVGLPMRGSYPAHTFTRTDENGEDEQVTQRLWIGWTTDEAKAEAARELEATVTTYRARDPRFSGWEVTVSERIA